MKEHKLRHGRRTLPNHFYHLTSVTLLRQPIFKERWAARSLIKQLAAEDQSGRSHTIAFVVMPDHFHWLVQANDGDISGMMRRVKSRTSHSLGKAVWMRGFHDRCLRKEEDIRQIARYIIANPLRANLVEDVRQYPHWDVVYL